MSYVTGISGNVISAASAGWAPTNSAEVSAIASAYATGSEQVVTAVGTSDSGITSINNSGLVDTAALRSADYSSLYVQEPLYISSTGDSSYIGISGDIGGVDSATCSSIASAYAESAASSKLDESATADFYSTSNPSGFVTSSYSPTFGYYNGNISSIDGTGLMGTDTAVVSTNTAQSFANIESGLPIDDTIIFDTPVTAIKITVPDEPGTEPWLNLNADNPEGNETVLAFAGSDSYYTYNTSLGGSGWTSLSFYDTSYLIDGGIRYISATGYSDGVTSTAELMHLSASSNFYSTSNPSGFIDSAYVDSAVSGKADESALSGYYTTANESGFLTAANSDGGVQVYATGTETSTNQFSAANASAGASIIAGTKARVRLWDSDYTGNIYASSIQKWNNTLDGSAIQYVAGSADATANGVLYILTGNA